MAVNGKISGDPVATTPTGAVMAGVQASANVGVPAALFATAAQGATADSAIPSVLTRTALKAVDTTRTTVVFLLEAGRQGYFLWSAGNFSASISGDPLEGIFIKANAVASTAGSWVRLADNLRPDFYGAAGDNSTDDLIPVNAAIAAAGVQGEIFLPAGKAYKVSARLTNTHSVRFAGPGMVLFDDGLGTGSRERLDLRGSRDLLIHNAHMGVARGIKLLTSAASITILSGPSTIEGTGGGGISNAAYTLDKLLAQLCVNGGLKNHSFINRGHGGKTINDWLGTSPLYNDGYLAADMATTHSSYYLEWDINTPAIGTVDQCYAKYRTGLQIYRAAFPIGTSDLFIGVPVIASDTPNGRDERLGTDLEAMCYALAEEFGGVLINTFNAFQRGHGLRNQLFNADLPDPQVIHPREVFNQFRAELIYEALMKCANPYNLTNVITNITSTDGAGGLTLAPGSLPSIAHNGIDLARTGGTWTFDGITYDGSVMSIKQADGPVFQLVWDYASSNGSIGFRVGRVDSGFDTWGPMLPLHTAADLAITPASPWTGTPKVRNKLRLMSPVGQQTRTAGAITQYATIATVNASAKPAQLSLIMCNASGGSSGDVSVPCRVLQTTGEIQPLVAVADCTTLTYGGIYPID